MRLLIPMNPVSRQQVRISKGLSVWIGGTMDSSGVANNQKVAAPGVSGSLLDVVDVRNFVSLS
jgi:hypothetical protein